MKNLHIYLLIIVLSNCEHSDAILSIICFRHPNTPLCRQRTDLQNFFKNSTLITTASIAPPVKSAPGSASAEADNYCNAYEPHYLYYCTPGTGNQNPQAAEFCQFYPTKCDPRNIQLSIVQDVDIRQTCLNNADTARQFCDGTTEAGPVKTLCDQYRRYCLTAVTGTPVNPLTDNNGTPPPQDLTDAEKAAEQQPSSPFKLSGKFAENFAGSKQNAVGTVGGINCEEQREKYQTACLGVVQQRNDDSSASSSKTSQSESSSNTNGKGAADQTLESICRMDLNVMKWFCKDESKISPPYLEHCDYYFNRCKKSSGETKQQEPLQQLLPADSTFCTDYHNQCYNPEEMKRLRICAEFAETRNTYCPGYPFARERIGCNKYRIYCQNLPPLKDIDGDLFHIA